MVVLSSETEDEVIETIVAIPNRHESSSASLPAPVVEAIKDACRAVSVAADAAIAEYGRGQFEININHNGDILRACDEAVLLRHLARRVARGFGYDVTFMGKPFGEDTGSGFHLHASLWDGEWASGKLRTLTFAADLDVQIRLYNVEGIKQTYFELDFKNN